MSKRVFCGFRVGALLLAVMFVAGCSGKKELSVTGIDPQKGPFTGGDPVVITGSGFQTPSPKGFTVYFGGRKSPKATILSDSQIRVDPPGGADGEVVDVEIVFDDAREVKMVKAYTFYDPAGNRLQVGDLGGTKE